RPGALEFVQQGQEEPRRVPRAVEEHNRRPGAPLQEMAPAARPYLDEAAGDRPPGQQAFVHLSDLGGVGLLGARLLPAAHRCLLCSRTRVRLGWTLEAGWLGGFGETPQSRACSTWGVLRSCD